MDLVVDGIVAMIYPLRIMLAAVEVITITTCLNRGCCNNIICLELGRPVGCYSHVSVCRFRTGCGSFTYIIASSCPVADGVTAAIKCHFNKF